jgi:hypothetical protein
VEFVDGFRDRLDIQSPSAIIEYAFLRIGAASRQVEARDSGDPSDGADRANHPLHTSS